MGFTAAGMVMLLTPFFQMIALNAAQQTLADPAMMVGLMGKMFLFYFALMVGLVMLMAAATRAVLRPAERAFAYIRSGMDELRLVGLNLLLLVGAFVLVLVLALVLGIVFAASGSWRAARPGKWPRLLC